MNLTRERSGSPWRRLFVSSVVALVCCGWSGTAFAEPPASNAKDSPSEARPSDSSPTSLMTLLPALTPISDYRGKGLWSAACALCLGEVGDLRQQLYDKGIALDVGLTNVAQGIVSGGLDKEWRYTGVADYQLSLDTDRLGLWPAGLIVLHARSKFGGDVLAEAGTISPVNHTALTPKSDDNTDSFLEEYYLLQVLSEQFSVIAGRVLFSSIGDVNVFANNEKTQFLNTSLRNSPLLGIISSAESIHGAAINYSPTPNFVISPYVLSNNDVDGHNGSPGGLFSEYSTGVQIATSWKIADRPGHFSPLFGYTSKNASNLDNNRLLLDLIVGLSVPVKKDNWVVGFSFDQYVYVPEGSKATNLPTADFAKEPEGVGVFLRFHYSPEDRNPWNVFMSGGVGGRGVIPGRPNDRYGVGFFALFESDDLKDQPILGNALDTEWGMEAFYNLALTPWFQFGPSLQYVDSGVRRAGDVIALSVRAQINF